MAGGNRTRREFLGLFLTGLAGLSMLSTPADAQTTPRRFVNSHLIPSRDNQYNLGSKDRRWRSLNTGPESIQVWNQPSDSQPSLKLTTEQITDGVDTAVVGSIQLGDGDQLKVSITGGGAGDLEEEVVIKSLLEDRGTGLNIVANGTPSDATSLRIVPKDDWSESFTLAAFSDERPHTLISVGDTLKPVSVTWYDGNEFKPSIVFRHYNGATLVDVQSDVSGKEALAIGVSSWDEAFIDQAYVPNIGGQPRKFWVGGWFNRETGSFTPGFRLQPPELIPGNYTLAQLGNRNSFTYDEWLTLFSRHEDSVVENGMDVQWNSSIEGSKPGTIYLGGWFNVANSTFQLGITQSWTGSGSDKPVTAIHTDTIIGNDSANTLNIRPSSENIHIENPSTETNAGSPAGYLKIKVGGQHKLIPLYEPPP